MGDIKQKDIEIPCEICEINSASEIKGGVYNNERQMWLVCKECLSKINDERKSMR